MASAKNTYPSTPVLVGLGLGAYYLYDPEAVKELWETTVGKWLKNSRAPGAVKNTPGVSNPNASTGATVPGLVPLGPGAGRYQPITDYSWLSNPGAYPPYGYPPYNGVPIGAPNVPPNARRYGPPTSRIGIDPSTGLPFTGAPRSPIAPPIAGLPPANILDPYLERFPRVIDDTYGGSFNPWAGSATQYLDEQGQPTNNYDFASTLPAGSATQYFDERFDPVQEAPEAPAILYSSGDGYSSNNQTVSYDNEPPAYEPPEAPAYEPVDEPEEDYGGSYNPYDQGQPDETYGGGDNPWTDDVYNNRGE